MQGQAETGLEFAEKVRFGRVIVQIKTQLALIRTLRGVKPKFGSFNDDYLPNWFFLPMLYKFARQTLGTMVKC